MGAGICNCDHKHGSLALEKFEEEGPYQTACDDLHESHYEDKNYRVNGQAEASDLYEFSRRGLQDVNGIAPDKARGSSRSPHESTSEAYEFRVELERVEAETFGLDVKVRKAWDLSSSQGGTQKVLEVQGFSENSAVSRWNASRAAADSGAGIICPGDQVLLVNGVGNNGYSMMQVCKDSLRVELVLRRRAKQQNPNETSRESTKETSNGAAA